jgi:hypothetical protein
MKRWVMLLIVVAAAASLSSVWGAPAQAAGCSGWGSPAIAADPVPHALRVFAVQFAQDPAAMVTAADYRRAIDCAITTEVLPHLARHRPNLVVFGEDMGLEAIATGSRGAGARALLRDGDPACAGMASPCETLGVLAQINTGYGQSLRYLQQRFPALSTQLGRGFVGSTDTFVRVFMTTMASAARRYGVYVIASNTQAPFTVSHDAAAVAALRGGGTSAYVPTQGVAFDQTFVWGPRVLHRGRPAPLANLLADNEKIPLTSFEQALGFGSGPSGGAAARRNLQPVTIPGTGARLGLATSLPAFEYEPSSAAARPCADVAVTYMRCLNALGANVVIQADANDGQWTGAAAGGEPWQPLDWMGSAYRAVSDPTVGFTYAVNPFMVGNLADTPFDGQSAILQRGLRGAGCHYVGNSRFVAGQDLAGEHAYAGDKPQFLALAPWAVSDGSRASLRGVGAQLAAGTGGYHYVQTALIADLPFPADRSRPDCVKASR